MEKGVARTVVREGGREREREGGGRAYCFSRNFMLRFEFS